MLLFTTGGFSAPSLQLLHLICERTLASMMLYVHFMIFDRPCYAACYDACQQIDPAHVCLHQHVVVGALLHGVGAKKRCLLHARPPASGSSLIILMQRSFRCGRGSHADETTLVGYRRERPTAVLEYHGDKGQSAGSNNHNTLLTSHE